MQPLRGTCPGRRGAEPGSGCASYQTVVFWVSTYFAVTCFVMPEWGVCKPHSYFASWLHLRLCYQRVLEGDCKAGGGGRDVPLPVCPPDSLLHASSKQFSPMAPAETNFQISQHLQKQLWCIPPLRHHHQASSAPPPQRSESQPHRALF